MGAQRRARAPASLGGGDPALTAQADVRADVDLVLDCAGGPGSARLLRTLRPGGALYPSGYDADELAALGVSVSATQVRASGTATGHIQGNIVLTVD